MALARVRRGESGMNYWPGFVDALSTLILGIIFLLTVFVVVQFYLQQEVAGKDTALSRLNAQIAQLTELLGLEKSGKTGLEDQLAQLRATLAVAESERDRLKGAADSAGAGAAAAQGKVSELSGQLEGEKRISARALAQVEVLNQQIAALRRQLAALEQTLDASEKKDKESQSRISELGQRLNLALAERVNELKRYRSDFFGKLREILGNRADVRIVGDRFVLQSEVFFDTARADLKPEGRVELDKVAGALVELEKQIPPISPGFSASTVIPTCGNCLPVEPSSRIGICRPRAPSRWCSISSAEVFPRNAWSPPVLANSSRSTLARPKTPTSAIAASNSS